MFLKGELMPAIAVNLSEKLIHDVRSLVEKGLYANLESFVEIGVFNQLALERGSTPEEIIERGHRNATDAPPRSSNVQPPTPALAKATASKKSAFPSRAKLSEKATKLEVVEGVSSDEARVMFGRLSKPASITLPLPLPMPVSDEPGEKIFGQVNRLFPIKFVCRWLLNRAAVEGQWPKFTAISTVIADDAGTLGSLLDQWDQQQKRERGGELATALPRRKNNASLDRFLSQFVARVTRASEVAPGAVCQYELARFDDATLALTEQGIAFASLDNPILDENDENSSVALSDAESTFLTAHIRKWVPTEWNDMRTVLLAVQSGKTTPTELSGAVSSVLPEAWSDSQLQTHVSGVIARLGDIRLLRRSWQGRNVRYELGESAQVNFFLDL